MTPREIINQIDAGTIPQIADIIKAFPGMPSIVSWHIRMASQGSITDAIMATEIILGRNARWTVSYDRKAVIMIGDKPYSAISITAGHALILAAIDAYCSIVYVR